METSDRPQPHAIPHVEGTRSLQFPRLSAVLSGDSIAGPFSNTQHRTNARETGLCVTLAQPGGRPQWEEALGPLVDVVVRATPHTSGKKHLFPESGLCKWHQLISSALKVQGLG